jgi:hypothetical protein
VQSIKPLAEEFDGVPTSIWITSNPSVSLNTYIQGHIELTIWYWQ